MVLYKSVSVSVRKGQVECCRSIFHTYSEFVVRPTLINFKSTLWGSIAVGVSQILTLPFFPHRTSTENFCF